jgi:hypothetical protein
MEEEAKRCKTDEGKEVACPRITFHCGGAHVWDVEDILALRKERIGGELVGADLGFPAQNISHGPPLTLAPEEVRASTLVLRF